LSRTIQRPLILTRPMLCKKYTNKPNHTTFNTSVTHLKFDKKMCETPVRHSRYQLQEIITLNSSLVYHDVIDNLTSKNLLVNTK